MDREAHASGGEPPCEAKSGAPRPILVTPTDEQERAIAALIAARQARFRSEAVRRLMELGLEFERVTKPARAGLAEGGGAQTGETDG